MNTDTTEMQANRKASNEAPIFFKLTDSDQDKAERTVGELIDLAETHGVSSLLQLHQIQLASSGGYSSTYSLNVETGQGAEDGKKVIGFLESIFSNMFHKHPAYTEPPVQI